MMKWGIYGAGGIAEAFANDFKKVAGSEIIAAYARKPERSKLFCEKNGIERFYFDEDAFFSDKDIEVVYISTPHALHAEVAIKALKSGKHILCEKPFAMNADEAKRVMAVAREEKRFVMEALWTLFLPAINKVMEWVKADRIGTVKAVQANFGFIGNNDPLGRLFNPDLGGGALLDVGIYPVLIANHIAQGTPISINAQAQFTETGVDASTFITAKYANGMLALFGASIETNLINHLVVYGEKGRIEVPLFWMADEATCYSQDDVEVFKCEESQKHGYHYEADAVCRAIGDGRMENETVSHRFTLELMETLDRIRAEVGLKYKQDR